MAVNDASGLGLSSVIKPKSLNVGVTGLARATYSSTPTGSPTITTRSDGKVCVQFTGSGSITAFGVENT